MAKTITFSYKDNDYTLEYTRRTIQEMERNGFVIDEVAVKPMTMFPALFAGAFRAHHRFIKQALVDEIYASLSEKESLIDSLVTMYNDTLATLIDGTDEGEKGNVSWTANF